MRRLFVVFILLFGVVVGYRPSGYAAQHQGYTRSRDVTEETPIKETIAISTTTTYTPSTLSSIGTSSSSSVTTSSSTSNSPSTSGSAVTPPATSSTTAAPAIIASEGTIKPATELPPKDESVLMETASSLSPMPPDDDIDAYKRRIITYDQRQEGQYNIRADLENFMIVLIPPSPTEGLNLLDLLTKSTFRRNSPHGNKGSKRKHYPNADGVPTGATRYRQAIKHGNGNQNFNYLSRQSAPAADAGVSRGGFVQSHHTQPLSLLDAVSSSHIPEFIEGRTPYHVDISSSDDEQLRLHPDRQVDVLPPPYPLAYQHLIKPFHLEVEPTVIQALPPSDIAPSQSSGGLLDTYNQLFTASQHGNTEASSNGNPSPEGGNYYRASRALRNENFIDSNRVTPTNSLSIFPERRSHVPLYRAELSYNTGTGNLYPPIDVPRLASYLGLSVNARTSDTHEDDNHEQKLENTHFGEIIVPPTIALNDDFDEAFLHDDGSFGDGETKALLSDGMERCAPGRRRDSYGVCREIEGY